MKAPAHIQQWVDDHGDWFEKAVLWLTTFDQSVMPKIAPILCIAKDGSRTNDFSSPIFSGYYQALRDHITTCPGTTVDRAVVQVLMSSAVSGGYLAPSELPLAMNLYDELHSQNLTNLKECVELGLAYWISKRRTVAVTQRHVAFRNWQADELASSLVEEIGFVQQTLEPVQHVTEFGAGIFAAKMQPVDCISTGLIDLDRKLGGGLHRKDGHLGIAAPGVGKTVFALQVATEAAVAGYVVAFVTTEQSESELSPRIISARCGIPFHKIVRGFDLGMLDPDEQNRVVSYVGKVKDKLFFFDWNKTRKSVEAGGLQDEIEHCIRVAGRCDLLVMDWLGGGLTHAARNDKDKKRLGMQNAADMCAQLAMDYNLASLVMAQAHKKDGVNNPMIGVGECTDCKTLDQKMTAVIGITGMFNKDAKRAIAEGQDPAALGLFDEKQCFFVSKARKSSGGHAYWKRNFAYQRMENWSERNVSEVSHSLRPFGLVSPNSQ